MPAVLPDLPKAEAAIVEFTNQARASAKLGAVTLNPELSAAARAYAAVLARTGRFSHDVAGSPEARVARTHYRSCALAENLSWRRDAAGFEARALALETLSGWIASPVHRANLLQPGMTEIGVGIAKSAEATPKYVAVQLLARPESAGLTVKIANETASPVHFTLGGNAHDASPRQTLTVRTCAHGALDFAPAASAARYVPVNGATYRVTRSASGALHVKPDPKP